MAAFFVPVTRSAVQAKASSGLQALEFGSYYALLIGNNEYDSFPRLETPRNDARALAELLRDSYRFEVETLLDADRSQIVAALDRFPPVTRLDLPNPEDGRVVLGQLVNCEKPSWDEDL